MKYIIGVLLTLLLLLVTMYLALGFWGISMFDAMHLNNAFKTIGILFVASILLVLIVSYFFKNPHKGYDTTKGNIAHPKK
ncbi:MULTISPECIES: hypothetical protein [Myroides]|uniref:Uncharacterized protein n=1 Tax=Myroides albus TaxID=2562892 RepID=A0A6I3LLJ8_9FLAO|nr:MULTISPECIES: hypothetical protein [Myroides]MTG98386.1 hypothetical protein [Myroides albus]MVX35737.1 hypothetical protein [Myroides sp. LoEW2-1]UVD80379.1 hypothetical protein NWE55_03665 [Myroides albus]